MESNEQNKLINKIEQTHSEQTNSCQRGGSRRGLGEKDEEIKKKKNPQNTYFVFFKILINII